MSNKIENGFAELANDISKMDFYTFMSKIEQEPLGIPDCNHCKWLNVTETQQPYWDNIPHICNHYGKRVWHRTREKIHDSYIWPCLACMEDDFNNFVDRKDGLI